MQWLLQHGRFKAALDDAQSTAVAVAEREGEGEVEDESKKKASEMLLQVGGGLACMLRCLAVPRHAFSDACMLPCLAVRV